MNEPEQWANADSTAVFQAILKLKTVAECEKFFRDILTRRELEEMITRFKIARLLDQPDPPAYLEIAQKTHASTTTVTRVAQWLRDGQGGYRLILDRLKS